MKNNLSKNLRKLRKEEGLSQEQLADLLSVSRQSVSKWETEDAYPEMDKIIFLCNKFSLDINDLLNGDIYEIKQKNEAINDVYKVIDKIIKFFTDIISLFFKMSLKSKVKFILEVVLLGVFLNVLFFLLGEFALKVLRHLFYNTLPNNVYYLIKGVVSFIYYLIVFILSTAIIIEIIKNRYLKYYKENKFEINDEQENKIILKEKEPKIIIRDQEDTDYKVFGFLYKILMFSIKCILVFILIPTIILLIFLAFLLAGSFLLTKTGFFFVGLIIVLLSSIIITGHIFILIANFIFNRKNNFKIFIYSTIINLIVFGLGIGFLFIGSLSFEITNEYDRNSFVLAEKNVAMHKGLSIGNLNIVGDIEYIEDKREDVKITYEYNNLIYSNKNLSKQVYVSSFETEDKLVLYFTQNEDFSINVFKNIFRSLNTNKVINYSDNLYNFKIYATKNNLKIIKENIEKND